MSKSLSNQENSKSALHIESHKNDEDSQYASSILVASKNGLVGRASNAIAIQKVALIKKAVPTHRERLF